MDRVKIFRALPLNVFAVLHHAAKYIVLTAFVLAGAIQPHVHAITINMVYSNEGDPVPHPENPSWDADGTILKTHFQAAKAIWESLLPGPGSYDFDFQWDDDIGATTLGLTTDLGPLGITVEINPIQTWFADATPGASEEFSTISQKFYSDLSSSDKTTYFTGAAPPNTLETGAARTGNDGNVGAGGYDAHDGYDLLSTIVHELGHVLGVNPEPGDFNIDPQHIGGVQNVTVLDNGGHLGGGPMPPGSTNIVPGFLMCDSCGVIGLRRLPTATDVLVIAEDQGISAVHLERVASISSGFWSNANGWIGGAVPDITQDVDIRHAGSIALDADAQARDLHVASGNSIAAQNHRLTANGTLDFDDGLLFVDPGGTIEADAMIGDTAAISTSAGSLVRFNYFTRGPDSTATSASFAGSVALGYNTGSTAPVAFSSSLNWNIGENLIIGDKRNYSLVVFGKTWNVAGNLSVGGGPGKLTILDSATANGSMTVGGNVDVRGSGTASSELLVDMGGALNVTGHIIAGPNGKVRFKGVYAPNTTYDIEGGATSVAGGPLPLNSYGFVYSPGGGLSFEGNAAGAATINVGGGVGFEAPSGLVTFQDTSSASNAVIHTKGGRRGAYSPYLCCLEEAGKGGQVRFEGSSTANIATIENEGVAEYRGGTGGLTVFADTSTASFSTFHNHGATYNKGGGGATHFLNSSTAAHATITNHADATFVYSSMSGQTVFYDSSNAGNSNIENQSGPNPFNAPGRTQFRNNSSAASATIENRGNPILGGGGAGLTEFYDTATAANATINLYEGYHDSGRTDFYNQSTAASAHINIVNTDPPGVSSNGGGGNLIFHDNSTAGQAQITLQAQACCNGVQFVGHATAANALIVQYDNSGRITFSENSSAGNANIATGQDNEIEFSNQSNASNATITTADRARVRFTDSASAGQSQIEIAGANAPGPLNLGGLYFNLNSTAGNATVVAYGGAAAGAAGARVSFMNGAHAGNATITANGGTGAGAGAVVGFSSGATGDTARLVANAGGTFDFGDQRTYGGTQVGSVEGAGTFVLNGSLLTTGNRNTSTIVSGPIVNGNLRGGMLTKVGAGTLTLAGANTYSGLTTVNAGTLSVTGSITGGAVVNSGGTLNGTGSIGGTVTVNSSGIFAPGASPGTITVGGLEMLAGGTLDFELGATSDRLIVIGNASLAGNLNASLLGGFTPTAGNSFNILDWSSLTGSFGVLNLAVLPNGLVWDTSHLYTTGELNVVAGGSGASEVVPEPDGLLLFVAGTSLLFMFSRRVKRIRAFGIVAVASSLIVIELMPTAVRATTVTVNGANGTAGTPGVDGNPSGTIGGNGGGGSNATATAAAPADTSNTATATGGVGGSGGKGGNGTSGAGGFGGSGGNPGNATATATTTANGGSTSANATATGGAGGAGGLGGSATQPGGTPGWGGSSTNGGTATASATVTNNQASGFVSVQARSTGGIGGAGGSGGQGPNFTTGLPMDGGDGGAASFGTVSGTSTAGGSVVVTATLMGGGGGAGGYSNGNGGDGSAASLVNAVAGSTTGSLSLTQDVTGGQGGATSNGAPGIPGTAASSMTLSNLIASSLTGTSRAVGGTGGGVSFGGTANGSNGATSNADISLTGKADVTVTAIGIGGNGGNAASSSGVPRQAGDGGTTTTTASGASTMGGTVIVTANNNGGFGGSGPSGGNGADSTLIDAVTGSTTGALRLVQLATGGLAGIGTTGAAGAGGDAISTLNFNQSGPSFLTIESTANGGGNAGGSTAPAAGSTALASIDATSTGTNMNLTALANAGAGCSIQAFGSNNNAADGGVAYIGKVRGIATSPGAVGLDLRATAVSGIGGDVSVGSGNGGNGGAASLVDVIDANASTTSAITLRQTALGGRGGNALGGAAGIGGAASSSLTRNFTVSSLNLTTTATGGNGGAKTAASGIAGAGGTAIAMASATSSGGSINSGATATGGSGGAGSSGASGGAGGNATANNAFGRNTTSQFVSVFATATGGTGGSASGNGIGGPGGTATINSVTGSSTGGAFVDVTAQQYGGQGGAHTSGTTSSGGNGAASSMTNIVSGSTSGMLTLTQEARSGAGGAGNGAAAGSSSNALSSLTSTNPGGGIIVATATATSGVGGSTFGTGAPGNSGDVAATMTVSSATNRVKATATAQAGSAGINSTNMASGTRGIATSMAHAITTGGFLADANAIVSGRNAMANAVADTSSGILSAMSLSATANPVNSSSATTVRAYGRAGSGFESFPGGVAAHAAGLPSANDVTNNVFGNPNVTAAYNSPDGKTPLALVALNMPSSGLVPALSITMSTSASLSFDVTTLQSGKLLVGLLDPVTSGPAFTSLHYSITREGSMVENQTFATTAAATTYFNDHVLDLGTLKSGVTGTLDLTFSLDMTTLDNGSGYGANFLIADVGLVSLPGDYSNNGIVDAADYVLWRKFNNTATTLPNDSTPGTNASDYNVWRAHFGQSPASGAGTSANTSVPEPATPVLLMFVAAGGFLQRVRTASKVPATR